MSSKSFYEKANELIEFAKKEKNTVIRQLRLKAAEKYYQADISRVVRKKPDFTKNILVILLFYVIIFGTAYISFDRLGFLRGLGVVVGTFALESLIMGVILRMRGDISETNFLVIVREGIKALSFLRR